MTLINLQSSFRICAPCSHSRCCWLLPQSLVPLPRDAGSIDLVWLHDGKVHEGKLDVPAHWRATDLGWRMSISQGVICRDPGFFPLSVSANRRQQLGLSTNAMAIEPYMGSSTNGIAYRAGLRGRDV